MLERSAALTAAFQGTAPRFGGPVAFAATGAAVLGRVRLGRNAWLGEFSVLRADGHDVTIGDNFHLGSHGTVHIAHDLLPTHIGDHVSAGARSVIHACDLASDCVIESGAIVLDGAKLGAGAVLTAGSVVFPRKVLEGGWIYSGIPARPVARIDARDLAARHQKVRTAAPVVESDTAGSGPPADCLFAAPTARCDGRIDCGRDVGIWYGCNLLAGDHAIGIGDGTNIQDNTTIRCLDRNVSIAGDVTVGHNVTLTDCSIETGSLVGIGAVISAGTVVESDVLVAAGAETETGQRLTGGQIWAGRPARPIGRMDDRKRRMIAEIAPIYRAYAEAYRKTDHHELDPIHEA